MRLMYRPSWRCPQVVSLGGFWVKLAQTASVVSALPDAHLDSIGGREIGRLVIRILKQLRVILLKFGHWFDP